MVERMAVRPIHNAAIPNAYLDDNLVLSVEGRRRVAIRHRECSKPALAFFARPEIEMEVALRDPDVEKQGPVDAGPGKILPTVRND